MKRFKLGNAVLCTYGENSNKENAVRHKKINKYNIELALNDMDRQSADFFESRLMRDFLLWVISLAEIIFFVMMSVYAFKSWVNFNIRYLLMLAICVIGLSLLFYLRLVCKARTPENYRARFWTDQQLQKYEMPSDEELLEGKK